MTWTGSTQEEPSPASAAVFFDARRGIYYARPMLRGWLHVVWFGLSVVGPLLLAEAHGAQQITARAIYATSVTALFGVSALYHRGHWTESGRRRMQRLDHMMIFFLIAGTATPVLLLTSPGVFGLACLIAVWALAAAGVCRPHDVDGGARAAGRRRLRGPGLGGRPGAAGPVDPRGRGTSRAGARGRPALHGRGDLLPPPPARSSPVSVRLPRGIPRLRLRRRGVPVRRDHPACRLANQAVASSFGFGEACFRRLYAIGGIRAAHGRRAGLEFVDHDAALFAVCAGTRLNYQPTPARFCRS